MPDKFKDKKLKVRPRGVANRNAGLDWIRKNAKDGVIFFADDDNTYDVRIFEDVSTFFIHVFIRTIAYVFIYS